MIWKTLVGHTHSAVRHLRQSCKLPAVPKARALDLLELEERIMMSATPMVPDLVPDADADGGLSLESSAEQALAGHTVVDAGDSIHLDTALSHADGSENVQDAAEPGSYATVGDITRHEVAFVDTSLHGYEGLLEQIQGSRDTATRLDIYELNPVEDGVEQISDVLSHYQQLNAVHILSHGTAGAVRLGDSWLTADRLPAYASDLAGWSDALDSQADLLLYGCDLAATSEGVTLLESLHVMTGADVAASVDVTGHAVAGGDWDLEFTLGTVEADVLLSSDGQRQWVFALESAYVFDGFESNTYSGVSGTGTWVGSWQEVGDDAAADSGNVQIVEYDLDEVGSRCLQINVVSGAGLYREVDLSAAASAQLQFDFQRQATDGFSGSMLEVQVSADSGASWHTLHVLDFGSDDTTQSLQLDISSFASPHTQIQFLATTDGSGHVFIDHVNVSYELGTPNAAPTLQVGDPFTLSDVWEDTVDYPGNSVAEILATGGEGRVADADPNTLLGMAVIGVDDTHGQWQFDALADGTWQNFGTVHDWSAVLLGPASKIRFLPHADYYGSAGAVQFRAWDQHSGAVGDVGVDVSVNGLASAFSSGVGTAELTVDPVNDDPELTLPEAQSVDEDADLAISGISISDVDAGEGVLRVGLSVSRGMLNLACTEGLSFESGDGSDDFAMIFTGKLSDINQALTTLVYRGRQNFVGPDTLLVGVSDEEHFGAGGPLQDSGSVAIDVLPVNDAPELTLPEAQVVDEDVDLLVRGLSIKDVDAGNGELEVTLRVEHGTLTVGGTDGLSFAEVLESEGGSVRLAGRLTDINKTLATLVYRGAENYYGDDRLSITVDDGGNSGAGDKLQDSGSVDIKVLPVNDAPVAGREKYAIRGDEVLLVSASDGLLANDSDIDGDRLGAVLVRPPLRGKVWLGANGSFRYVPDPSFIGNDSFVYVATDGEAVSAPTLVIVKVSAPTSPVETDPGTAPDPTNSGSTGTTPASQALDPTKHLAALVDAQLPEGIGESYAVTRVAGRAQTSLIASQVAGLDTGRSLSAELVNLSGAGDVGESRLSARARYLEEIVELTAAPIQYVTTVPELILQGVDVATLSNDIVELDIVLDDATALHRLMVGSAVGITTGLTVGYVFWTVRAGYLLTSLVAQMPAWRFVDPLPILNSFDADTTHTDTDSLESIAGSGAEEA